MNSTISDHTKTQRHTRSLKLLICVQLIQAKEKETLIQIIRRLEMDWKETLIQ
jgi:hypothetical protein